MALIALLLIPLATNLVAVSILLALWGVLSTAAPVGWWSWVAHASKADTESGGGLMVATVQLVQRSAVFYSTIWAMRAPFA